MTDLDTKLKHDDSGSGASLAKGSLAFLGGILVCGTALLLQAAVLHALSPEREK